MRSPRLLALLALALGLLAAAPAIGEASPAPVLRAHGETLRWTTAGTRNEYRLSTETSSGRTLSMVEGRTITPPPVPGATVTYQVKAAYGESAWSNEVSIAYAPTEEPEQPPEGGEPPPEEAEQPEGGEPPPEGGTPPSVVAAGHPKYRLDAGPYFAPFSTLQYAPWVREKIAVIKGYPPFSDIYVGLFGLPLLGYHDPATEGQAPLGHAGIDAFVAEVRRDMSLGYAGVFVDDANWTAAFPPSPGPPAALANLLVAIRAAEPTAVIEMNSQYHDIWPLLKAHNPEVERALRAVNIVTKEFGVGPSAGINTAQDYSELLQYIDALHAKGIHVTMAGDPAGQSVPAMEYNLATYLLANDGGDYVNGARETPLHWWRGFDVNLGSAVGERERSPTGVWKRAFTGGAVYTVEPGAARQTIKLGKPMHSAQWGTVQSVTLEAGQGAVLVG